MLIDDFDSTQSDDFNFYLMLRVKVTQQHCVFKTTPTKDEENLLVLVEVQQLKIGTVYIQVMLC